MSGLLFTQYHLLSSQHHSWLNKTLVRLKKTLYCSSDHNWKISSSHLVANQYNSNLKFNTGFLEKQRVLFHMDYESQGYKLVPTDSHLLKQKESCPTMMTWQVEDRVWKWEEGWMCDDSENV